MKKLRKAKIIFYYFITFIIIPFVVFFLEMRNAYDNLEIISEIKTIMSDQWALYKKFMKGNR